MNTNEVNEVIVNIIFISAYLLYCHSCPFSNSHLLGEHERSQLSYRQHYIYSCLFPLFPLFKLTYTPCQEDKLPVQPLPETLALEGERKQAVTEGRVALKDGQLDYERRAGREGTVA